MTDSPVAEAAAANNPVAAAYAHSVKFHRAALRRALEGELTPEQLVFQIRPSGLNIAWIVGHLALFTDRYLNPALGAAATLPEDYQALFGPGGDPPADPDRYPPLAELSEAFRRATKTTLARLEVLSDAELEAPLPEGSPLLAFAATVGQLVPFANSHIAYHLGQIGLLRRAQGLPTGLGV